LPKQQLRAGGEETNTKMGAEEKVGYVLAPDSGVCLQAISELLYQAD
jgi:hypothetical protein